MFELWQFRSVAAPVEVEAQTASNYVSAPTNLSTGRPAIVSSGMSFRRSRSDTTRDEDDGRLPAMRFRAFAASETA